VMVGGVIDGPSDPLISTRRSLKVLPRVALYPNLERRILPLFGVFSTEFHSFSGQLRHRSWRWTYNVRKILSPSSIFPLPKLTHPAIA